MKVLTLIQPWATLIMLGEKTIETRCWDTKFRGILAIHAGKKIDKTVFEKPYYREVFEKYGITPNNIPTGCILGTCQLTDTKPSELLCDHVSSKERVFGDYSPKRFGWILTDIKTFDEPIPAKGMLGLWNYERP